MKARPTTDMAREALFNLLKAEVSFKELDVLDLFSGTGAISIEFLSRGARSATAIDIDFISKKFIEGLKKNWNIENLKVVKADVFKLIKNTNQAFDLVFADPPYAHKRFEEIPELIHKSGWLKADGLLIVEHGDEIRFDENPNCYAHRNYGSVNFSFFRF